MPAGRPFKNACTKEELMAKIIEYHGNCYRAYTELGCPYSQFLKWCEDEDFKQCIEDARKKGVQFAENKLFELIEQGNDRLLRFYLSAKGGYSTKKEIVIDAKNVVDVNAAIENIKTELQEEPDKD